VVHDLKNPLAGILANGEFILGNDALDVDTREAMQDIVGSSEIMNQMVMNLLDISRAEDGALAPKPARFDVSEMFAELTHKSKHRLEARRQKLVTEVVDDARLLFADRSLVYRILENLLDNCIKYTPASGTITIMAR